MRAPTGPERDPAGAGPAGAEFARDVLWPFAWTRLALAAVAWLGSQLSPSWTYPFPEAARRGWAFVRALPLDAFGRWDAHWYLDLAAGGYAPRGGHGAVQSNLAFFPLYPWLVRGADALVPAPWRGPESLYLAALLVSNAAAIGALALLLRFAREVLGDPAAASRAVLYLLLFPAGFFLSAPYPESLFLLLSVGSLRAAWHGRPGAAGALGLLAALSRPGGVLLALPLAWMALSPGSTAEGGGNRRRPGRAPARLALSLLPALGLALHALHLWRLTEDPLALFHVQSAWGRAFAWPWRTLAAPRDFHPWLGPLEAVSVAGAAALGASLLREPRTRALGAWALASLAPVAFSGTLLSATRFAGVLFPCFLALGALGRRPGVDRGASIAFAMLQAALFLLWSRFFWVA
jgi:hypothetical protein